jgi:hypothetical protein
MIPSARRRPVWTHRSASELRFLQLAAMLADEALVHAPGGEIQRALARAERALRTAACCVREMDRAA